MAARRRPPLRGCEEVDKTCQRNVMHVVPYKGKVPLATRPCDEGDMAIRLCNISGTREETGTP